ncbi:MAG: hypothetical protein IJY12_05270 [Clostridia bacterium]|nr:hypothetical protein [Clostridia bacterium]
MAENNMDFMSGLVGTLMSNPALIQTALSLFSNKNDGASQGMDIGALLGALGNNANGTKTAEPNPTEAASSESDGGSFDLEAFLSSLSQEERKTSEASDSPATPSDDGVPAGLPVSVQKNHPPIPHGQRSDTALLLALRPYLNRDRRAMIDNIVRLGRLMEAFHAPDTKNGSI